MSDYFNDWTDEEKCIRRKLRIITVIDLFEMALCLGAFVFMFILFVWVVADRYGEGEETVPETAEADLVQMCSEQ